MRTRALQYKSTYNMILYKKTNRGNEKGEKRLGEISEYLSQTRHRPETYLDILLKPFAHLGPRRRCPFILALLMRR